MKKFLLPALCLLVICSAAPAQTPGIIWSKYIKTHPDMEFFYDGQRTVDKGYILIGSDTGGFNYKDEFIWTKSNNGAGWMTRLDSTGTLRWSRWMGSIGGALLSVQEVSGGFVTAGYISSYPDTAHYYVSKRDGSGNALWERSYGGSGEDRAYSLKATTDGGYIVAGFTNSNNGDVLKVNSERDAWIIKLDANGDRQWAAAYGGSQEDTAYAICQMPDGGYLVCGASSSTDGDLPANKGSSDGWVFKIDATGALVWKKNFGGSAQDVLNNLVRNADNTYTLSGYSFSNDGDLSGNHGSADFWVITIDDSGNLLWSKLYGGSNNDASFGLQTASANGSFVTGFTQSADGEVTDAAGGVDCWTLRLDANGTLLWQKASGTVNNEYAMAVMPTNDVDFAIAGFGSPGSFDGSDGLIIKYSNANTIKGTIYLDANSNGIRDGGEKNFDHAIVKTQKDAFSVAAMPYNGSFMLHVDTGTYTTAVQLFSPYYTVLPASQTNTFSSYYNQDSIGFAVQPIPNKKDLFIAMHAVDPARPGFEVRYQVLYRNAGTVNIPSGTIQLSFDPTFTYQNASPAPAAVTGNTVTWNYTNLNPFDSASILVTLRLAAMPGANLGDTVRSVAAIGPVAGDETPADDTAVLKQLVQGSYDPNDKTEANAGVITPAQVNEGEYLHYLIRFQNMGTDTAFNITVRDTLESRLDWNSLQMISASHSYQLAIEDGNKLTWQFSKIKLPYSGINEPASHGYISYRIKPLSTVQVGDTIKNRAGIYFDFNPPVITNTDRTIVLVLTPLPVTLVSFQAALKGAAVHITWKTGVEENVKEFEVERSTNGIDFTTIGFVQAGKTNYLFLDEAPLAGKNYYRLKPVDQDGAYSFSPIVMVNVKRDDAIIASVYPNPGNGNLSLKLEGMIDGNVLVQVLDQQGRLVGTRQFGKQHTTLFKTPLDLGKLSKGSYLLKIIVSDKAYMHKLLIR